MATALTRAVVARIAFPTFLILSSGAALSECYQPGCYSVYGDWGRSIYESGSVAWTTSDDMAQTLTFACNLKQKRCQWEAFIQGADCKPGTKTRALLVGSAGSDEVPARCAPSPGGRLLLLDGDPSRLFELMTGRYVTVATRKIGDSQFVQGRFSGKGADLAVTSGQAYFISRTLGLRIPPNSETPPDLAESRDQMIKACIQGAMDSPGGGVSPQVAAKTCLCASKRLLFGAVSEAFVFSDFGLKAMGVCLYESLAQE